MVRKYFSVVVLTLIIIHPSNAQKSNDYFQIVESKEAKVISIFGVNIEKYGILTKEMELAKGKLLMENFDCLTARECDLKELILEQFLCAATDECDKELLEALIAKGVNLNSSACDGDNPITSLAYCDDISLELTKMMLKNGANINGTGSDNVSFLFYAISNENHELVDYLIKNGADKIQRDTSENAGCLPIHGCRSLKMLKKLEQEKFEINAICNNGYNLLHYASIYNNKDIAQYLVENRLVDINLKDKTGKTPLDYAVSYNRQEIAKIINGKK